MFPVYEQKKENVHILQKTSRHAPPHLHNSVEFIYVISGSMEIGMGQELFHMDEGDFAVIFPDVIHHYQVFEKGKNKSGKRFGCLSPGTRSGGGSEKDTFCAEHRDGQSSIYHDSARRAKASGG